MPVPDHLALKRLTASDLTLFESLFRRLNAGNQKAINLNADVFTGVFYPSAAGAAQSLNNEIPVALRILGPGAKPEHRVARKIIKNATYKNWRLDGEFIPGPDDDKARYDSLRPGDLALISFSGDPLPTHVDIVLLAQSEPADAPVNAVLAPRLVSRSMVPLTPADIVATIAQAKVSTQHPIHQLVVDPSTEAALEDAA